jgi:hypothetical protein
MGMANMLRRLREALHSKRAVRRPIGFRPALVRLEDRALLSTVQVAFSESSSSGSEANSAASVTVALSAASLTKVTVQYRVAAGTAVRGVDYRLNNGTLTFKPGDTTENISIAVLDNHINDPDKTIRLQLFAPTNASLGATRSHTFTIVDADPPPVVAFTQSTASGREANPSASLSVTLSSPSGFVVSVAYAVTGGTAVGGGVDYSLDNGTLTFQPGDTAQSIPITLVDNGINDPDKTIEVSLSAPTNATLGATAVETFTMIEADPPPQVAFAPITWSGNESTPAVDLPVALSMQSGQTVTVNYAVTGGTAVAGTDYNLAAGTLTFQPGDTTASIPLSILDDGQVEADKTIEVALSSPIHATLGDNQLYTYTIIEDPTVSSTGPHILLTPTVLANLRQQAADNTPQWQAFKAQLDHNLDVIIADDIGSYQADHLKYISDYALGYQVLKDSDPVTASAYADKAIALIKSGLNDYQKGSWVARQFLVRGNGKTRTFTLPNADLDPSTLMVYLSPVTTQAVVRGPANTQDTVGSYKIFLKVSNTPDGPANYVQGTDWQHNPDYSNDDIDWSLPGKEPVPGMRYYVTMTSLTDGITTTTAYTLSGNTITFTTAPAANRAVFVQYIYGTHSADGSALAYQQTSAGDGGFNSIFVDTGYTSRYLGKHIAMGLDWLDGYVGFSPVLEQQAASLLVRWSDYLRDNGYYAGHPESNYEAGAYDSRVLTALALSDRDPAGPRLLSEVLDYRQVHVLSVLLDSTTSLNGGFWSEGWNYGALATENLLTAGLALQTAGLVDTTAVEGSWASDVIEQLLTSRAGNTLYDGGDWYTYPAPFPGTAGTNKDLFYFLSTASSNPSDRAYANYVLQNDAGQNTADYTDLLFHDPSAPAAFWSALPLEHFATGTGMLSARSDWGSTANVVDVQMGNLLNADHQTEAPGQLELARGGDQLLINTNAEFGPLDPTLRTRFSNMIVVDSHGDRDRNGQPVQTYPYSTGDWYGTPGVVTNAYEAASDHVYLYGDYHAAYSTPGDPGGGGPVSELTRQVVYLRPDYVIVYDRVTTLKASYAKQLRWHFLHAPVVSGNTFVETSGGSKLFGHTFSTAPLTTTRAAVAPDPSNPHGVVQQLITRNRTAATSVRYVTALQLAPSATKSMDASQHVMSSDGRMEGVQIGNQVVLFGRNGDVDATTPVSYRITATGSVQHLLTNLAAGQNYQITVNGVVLETVAASSQGTLSFTTTTAGTLTLTVQAAG